MPNFETLPVIVDNHCPGLNNEVSGAGVQANRQCVTQQNASNKGEVLAGKNNYSRIIEFFTLANRRHFDSSIQSFGVSPAYIRMLETRLNAYQADIARLQAQVDAFEAGTIWRLTLPLRWIIEALRSKWPKTDKSGDKDLAPLSPGPGSVPTYAEWIAKAEAVNASRLMEAIAGGKAVTPRRLAVVMVGHTLKSQPTLRNWPNDVGLLILEDGVNASPPGEWPHHAIVERRVPGLPPADMVTMALGRLDADLVCFLDGSEVLSTRALQLVMAAVARHPDLDIVFGDEDWLDEFGQRTNPFFKPGWNPELQRGRDLIGPCAFFRTDLLRTAKIADGLAWRYDLANQITLASRPERIGHVPALLCHRHPQPPGYAAALQAAAGEHLRRLGLMARVETISGASGLHRVVYELPALKPRVSVIVPTRDRPELLQVCAEAVLQQTDYPSWSFSSSITARWIPLQPPCWTRLHAISGLPSYVTTARSIGRC